MKAGLDKIMLQKDPEKFYEKYINNRVILVKGKPMLAPEWKQGRIIQVIDGKLLLVQAEVTQGTVIGKQVYNTTLYGDVYALEVLSTQKFVDGDFVGGPVAEIGVYEYTSVAGAGKKVRKYSALSYITFDQFTELKTKGTDFLPFAQDVE